VTRTASLLLAGLCVARRRQAQRCRRIVPKRRADTGRTRAGADSGSRRLRGDSDREPDARATANPKRNLSPVFKGSLASSDVKAFRLAPAPVTRGDFLGFLRCHPEWRRSRATARFRVGVLERLKSDSGPGAAPLERRSRSYPGSPRGRFAASRGWRLPPR